MKSPSRLLRNAKKTVTEWQMIPIYYRLAGRLKPLRLTVPEHKQKALVISFDTETFPENGETPGQIPAEYSDYFPRLLKLFESFNANAHFFVSGRVIELYQDLFKSIVNGGHGLGGHGYMHENMSTLDYAQQRKVIETFKNTSRRLMNVEPFTWRSPYAKSNFDTYRALHENGFLLSSSTALSNLPLRICGVVEVPYTMMDGDVLGYLNPLHWNKWTDAMKKATSEFARNSIIVMGMHPWLHMIYDPKLEGLENFLSWLEPKRETIWIGSFDAFLKTGSSST